jgi:hypothetical protein
MVPSMPTDSPYGITFDPPLARLPQAEFRRTSYQIRSPAWETIKVSPNFRYAPSRKEQVCPHCVSFPFGASLPCCVRMTSDRILVDGATGGEVGSETSPKGPFHQQDDGFAWIWSCGTPHRDHSGVRGVLSALKGQKNAQNGKTAAYSSSRKCSRIRSCVPLLACPAVLFHFDGTFVNYYNSGW